MRSGAALYQAALAKSRLEKIDVGHIILNFGNAQNNHALAAMALKSIRGEADGAKLVNQAFVKFLDMESFSEDQLNLLQTATGAAFSG
jgi:hypothetical protein